MANRKPIFSFIPIIIFTTLLISVYSQEAQVSFNITNFTPGDSRIILQGSASNLEWTTHFGLRLNDDRSSEWSVGRALFSKQVRLYDRSNGRTASFVTSFEFSVLNNPPWQPDSTMADGFIFFLSPTLQIPRNSSGGYLGVVDPTSAFNNFVGVEFDNYVNSWDPNYTHFGINVNSLYSPRTKIWNRSSGNIYTVRVEYDSSSKTLSVRVTYRRYGQMSTISQVVDLAAVLPEYVWIGLSASTSGYKQITDVHKWSCFVSSLTQPDNLLHEQK